MNHFFSRTLRASLLSISILLYFIVSAQQLSRPKLVVGIVVDQMRWDYLYRYYDRYGDDGFRRMLNEGFSCNSTYINYLPSYTAVGHTTIFTGTVPAIHGITGNGWVNQITGRKWYCTEDTTVSSLGTSSDAGEMSPHNLLASTITDELMLATNFRSKVIGVSLKDRAAILPAGHAANGAFWYDNESGDFISSTYYFDQLPEWVVEFNKKNLPSHLVSGDWHLLYPKDTYLQSSPDDVAWEGTYKGETDPVFPHKISEYFKKDKGVIRATPYGNTLSLEIARAALEANEMGADAITDFLTINLASTDYVGHQFGPNSIEVEDTYVRLDKDLASFFSYLDKKIGKGNYTLFLSADHGAAHAINFMKAHQIPSDFLHTSALTKGLIAELKQRFGSDKIISSATNYHIGLDRALIDSLGLNYTKVKTAAVNWLQRQEGIQFAVDIETIGKAPIPEPLKTMIINGYNSKRSGVLIIIPEPGVFSSWGTGTTHGSWNNYDTHIPLVFMGWGVSPGHSAATYHMTDIAPTLAALLHIQVPNGSIGKVITEVVK